MVTAAQLSRLERFSEQHERRWKSKIFRHGPRNSLIAQNYVGVIHLGTWQVEVLPKITDVESQARNNLLKMVAGTLKLKLHGSETGQLETLDHSLLEALIRLYCKELWQALHKGIVKRYETKQDNLVVLRGRLNITQQLRRNFARPDRLYCQFDQFTPDNELNRALKLSLRTLLKVVETEQSSRSIAELLLCFEGVSDVAPSSLKWNSIVIDRLSEPYSALVRIARLFIEGYSQDFVSGNADGFALLFDMNELFEEYVGRQIQRVTALSGVKAHLQSPVLHLASRQAGGSCFQLRPDVVVMEGATPAIVLDTKWKRLNPAVSHDGLATSDIYQMYAYSQRYGVKDVILLYPHYADLGPWRALRSSYFFQVAIDPVQRRTLSVATIEMHDLQHVPRQLNLILEQAISGDNPSSLEVNL
jgi:5-methylcytosine-specific restriction enzyme subunit McrC